MNRSGFTLLEMSIVILIIGIMIAGISMGKSMIETAQIQRVIGEYGTYTQAIGEFQDKYMMLPGDIDNAETMWGTDSNGCPATANSIPKKGTCNGDGNGHIGDSTSAAVLSDATEWWRAWQHLANAGLIDGTFTGAQGAGGTAHAVLDNNVPSSSIEGSGWTLNYYLRTSDGELWADKYGHILNLGAVASNSYTKAARLSTTQALSIDQKIDDGLPGTGKVRAWRTSVLANCTENDSSQTAQTYVTSETVNTCALIFILGF